MAHHFFVIFACIEIFIATIMMHSEASEWASVSALAAIAFATLAVATRPERRKP